MRILLLAHRLPWPIEVGQNHRLYNLVRLLSQRHQLYLVAFGTPPYAAEIAPFFREIRTVPIPASRRAPVSLGKVLHALDPHRMIDRIPEMDQLIRETLERARAEVIWVGGWDMLVYAAGIGDVPVVADAMDEGLLESWRSLRRARSPIAFLRTLRQLLTWVRWERHYFRRTARCLFVSEVDARWAQRVVPGLRVSVIENGVDAAFYHPIGAPEDWPSVIFEGNQSFLPNADAAAYFARSVLPLVRRVIPDCRFFVVGREPDAATRALASPHVVVTGRVDDVRPWLDRASVFVCPMRMGAGIKNKILQAWAMAKPVVATPTAVGGLSAVPGENIVVARSTRAFAASVVRLLRDPITRAELGKRGRETILTRYSWEQQAGALDMVMRNP
jgi:glycosyltransferase involved in cell wall biosynthesis